MKLSAGAMAAFCARPPAGIKAALIHGPDAAEVAQRRRALIQALAGPDAEAELRVTALDAMAVRADPAIADDALRATGFFPGRRVVWIADATDALAEAVGRAADAASPEDAWLIVTASALAAKGRLRGLFEGSRDMAALACHGDPPDRAGLDVALRKAGCTASPEGLAALEDVARTLDAGALAQLVESLALYKLNDLDPLSADDVAACAPPRAAEDAEMAAAAVADRRPEALRAATARLAAHGVDAAQIVGATMRRFRLLHAIAVEGGDAGVLNRVRPPVFGPRRDAIARAARHWSAAQIEAAIVALHELDAALRSGDRAPRRALMERTLLKIALSPER
ncbi:MAG: DNA polymerase III subunit delta [Rubrimonas sp.]|uniref:DNA polymerase III subunit delta n=1 Tax=Rubrimonas sp. TaxID=2036015 RepID=UPI002FDEBEFD